MTLTPIQQLPHNTSPPPPLRLRHVIKLLVHALHRPYAAQTVEEAGLRHCAFSKGMLIGLGLFVGSN